MKIVVATTTLPHGFIDLHIWCRFFVEQRLAACVQIKPIESVYLWQGKTEQEREYEVSFKTSKERLEQLCEAVHEKHPYDCPQWIVHKCKTSSAYGEWVSSAAT